MPSVPIEPLSRIQLESVLGLGPNASPAEIVRCGERLLAKLEGRLERERDGASARPSESGPTAESHEASPLALEIERLRASLDPWRVGSASGVRPSHVQLAPAWTPREQVLLATALALALFAIFLTADRLGFFAPKRAISADPSAALIVESRPEGAELRIKDLETEELLLRLPATAAKIELEPGRYSLELSREDCPDVWSRRVELEPAETRRFEPEICLGAGELVVRSNVAEDRLRVDELDLGATGAAVHLLGTGDHDVHVMKKGYAPFEGKVRIRPDERIELRVDLIAAEDGSSSSSAPALPFDVVPPTKPPSESSAQPPGRAVSKAAPAGGPARSSTELAAAARVPLERIVPDPIRPTDFEPPKARFDFEGLGSGKAIAPGGSTPWLDRMTARVLRAHDTDRSGQIDARDETDAIPCTLWRAIEGSFDEAGLGLSMARFYGFDGTEWHPRALGFSLSERAAAYARMKTCGLAS